MAAPDSQSQGTNEKRLRGKVAAITGAGAGNGRATVLRLGHDGASVFISDIDQERVDETLKALREVGIEADGGIFDASKAEDAGRFIDAVIARYGQLDILVNNAGAIRAQPFPEVTEETWDWVMDLNLKGAYFYMQEACQADDRTAIGYDYQHRVRCGHRRRYDALPTLRGRQGRSH